MQIFVLALTAGVEHLSGEKLSRSEIEVGLRIHARSCSCETIQTRGSTESVRGYHRKANCVPFACCWAQSRNSLIMAMVELETVAPGTVN